jgi:hypothetical protein
MDLMTFLRVKPIGRKITVNVSRNGEPFGQLWTWSNTRTERHPWHSKPLDGEHKTHKTQKAARKRMLEEAK